MTKIQAVKLANKIDTAAWNANDQEMSRELFDIVADLINHANGHETWLTCVISFSSL